MLSRVADALGWAIIATVIVALWIATPAWADPDDNSNYPGVTFTRSYAPAGGLVSEARRWIGASAAQLGVRRNLWCVAAINRWLVNIGRRSTGTEMARALLRPGRRISGPRVGAIAVLSRGRRGGHAGVVTAVDARGNPTLISGNHNNRVAEATYPAARVLGYVIY